MITLPNGNLAIDLGVTLQKVQSKSLQLKRNNFDVGGFLIPHVSLLGKEVMFAKVDGFTAFTVPIEIEGTNDNFQLPIPAQKS